MKKASLCRRLSRLLATCMVLLVLIPALPAAAKAQATEYAKVKIPVARLFKSTSNTRTYVRMNKGSVVTVLNVKGKWAKVRARGRVGYVQTNSIAKITKSKPAPKLRVLSRGKKGTDVLSIQKRLAALGYMNSSYVNGRFGAATQRAIRKYQLVHLKKSTGKANAALQKALLSDDAHKMPDIINLSWPSSSINSHFGIASIATIIDVNTGTSLNVRRLFGSNHLDVEPATKNDTKKLKQIYGGKWSWASRGVLLKTNGKYYAASINSMPHGQQSNISNGYKGQFCIHLKDSKTHGSNKVNAAHQKKIKDVVAYFQKYS